MLLVFIYTLLLAAYFICGDWYINAGNAYLRIPVFILGICAKIYGWRFNWWKVVLLGVTGGLTVFALTKTGLDFFIRLAISLFVPAIMYVLAIVFDKVKTPFLSYNGGISLEIYLAHILTINLFMFYGFLEALGCYAYIVIPLITYIIAIFSKSIIKIYESSSCSRIQ